MTAPNDTTTAPTWLLVVGLLLLAAGAISGQVAKTAVIEQQLRARGLDPSRHRPSADDERAASDSPAVLIPAAGLGGIGCVLILVYVRRRRARRSA